MTKLDALKAVGAGVLVMALDWLIATAVIFAWDAFVAPVDGREGAVQIATWSTRIVGPILLLLAVWILSGRKTSRNALSFAIVIWLAYVLLDGAVVLFSGLFTAEVVMTLALKLAGALAGAAICRVGRLNREASAP